MAVACSPPGSVRDPKRDVHHLIRVIYRMAGKPSCHVSRGDEAAQLIQNSEEPGLPWVFSRYARVGLRRVQGEGDLCGRLLHGIPNRHGIERPTEEAHGLGCHR